VIGGFEFVTKFALCDGKLLGKYEFAFDTFIPIVLAHSVSLSYTEAMGLNRLKFHRVSRSYGIVVIEAALVGNDIELVAFAPLNVLFGYAGASTLDWLVFT
jgi:hypothetical protein